MSFAELQAKMQIGKISKQGVKYSFRNAEDIFTHFKTLNSGWEINVSDDLVEVGGRIFVKATATATKDDEVRSATRFSELDTVPILNTKDYNTGDISTLWKGQRIVSIINIRQGYLTNHSDSLVLRVRHCFKEIFSSDYSYETEKFGVITIKKDDGMGERKSQLK